MSQTFPTPQVVESEQARWTTPVHTLFKRNLSKRQIEIDVLAYLKEWLPSYVSEQEVQEGFARGHYIEFQDYTRVNQSIEKFPESATPTLVVSSPGLFEEPVKDGEGNYRAKWSIVLGIIASGNDYEETMDMTSVLTAATRMCMVQGPTLNKPPYSGYIGNKFLLERYDDIDLGLTGMNRTVGVGSLLFWVEARNVVSSNAGPTAEHPFPDHDTPYLGVDGIAETVTTEVIPEP